MSPSAKDPVWDSNGRRAATRHAPAARRQRPGGGAPFIRILIAAWIAALLLGAGAAVAGSGVAAAVEALAAPSWAGALDVLFVGTLIGVVAGVPFLLLRQRGQRGRHGRRPVGRPWLGAAWGAAVFGVIVAVLPEAARAAVTELPLVGAAAATVVLVLPFVGWGLALEEAASRLFSRPRRPKLELHAS